MVTLESKLLAIIMVTRNWQKVLLNINSIWEKSFFFAKKCSFHLTCTNTSFLGSCHDLINYLASGSSAMVEPLTHNPMFLGLNSAVTGTGSRKIANTIKISTYALVSEVF
jgi:hypothetical protein